MKLDKCESVETGRNSIPLDLTTARSDGCFTTLAARVNKRDEIANIYATDAITDWDTVCRDDSHIKIGQTFSPGGNVTSFWFPECSEENLPILAWVMQFAYIYDDFAERQSPHEVSHKNTLKKLLVNKVTSMVDTTKEPGLSFLKSFQAWTKDGHAEDEISFKGVDDYMDYRIHNSGMKCYWGWLPFTTGSILSQEEWDSMKEIMEIANAIYILTNDYFSWPREKFYEGNHATNVINLYMREGRSEHQAMRKTQQELLRQEQLLHQRCAELSAPSSTVSHQVKALLPTIEAGMGGYHYWASTCLRFNFWKHPGLSPDATFNILENNLSD